MFLETELLDPTSESAVSPIYFLRYSDFSIPSEVFKWLGIENMATGCSTRLHCLLVASSIAVVI